MSRFLRVTASPAQARALEFREVGVLDRLISDAWQRATEHHRRKTDCLFFARHNHKMLARALLCASRAASRRRDIEGDALAGRAARSLAALAGKVLKAGREARS